MTLRRGKGASNAREERGDERSTVSVSVVPNRQRLAKDSDSGEWQRKRPA